MCIVCMIRKLMTGGRTGGYGRGGQKNKIGNIAISYDFIFPSISYKLFKSEIGLPRQDSCVVCL